MIKEVWTGEDWQLCGRIKNSVIQGYSYYDTLTLPNIYVFPLFPHHDFIQKQKKTTKRQSLITNLVLALEIMLEFTMFEIILSKD